MLVWRTLCVCVFGGRGVQINILNLFQVIKQQSLITRSNNLPALITTAIVKCQSEKQYKQSVTLPINTAAIKNISDISASLPLYFFFLFSFVFFFFCFTSGLKWSRGGCWEFSQPATKRTQSDRLLHEADGGDNGGEGDKKEETDMFVI